MWNISDATVVYQSAIVSSSPFLCIAMNQLHESFAIGSADGQVEPIVPVTLYFSIVFFKSVTSITSRLQDYNLHVCMLLCVCFRFVFTILRMATDFVVCVSLMLQNYIVKCARLKKARRNGQPAPLLVLVFDTRSKSVQFH